MSAPAFGICRCGAVAQAGGDHCPACATRIDALEAPTRQFMPNCGETCSTHGRACPLSAGHSAAHWCPAGHAF